MHAMRASVLMLIAALGLIAAGCGGTIGTAAGVGTGPSSAAELKPGALLYWETVSDPGSDEWKQAEELLRRFPDGEKWIADLRQQVADEGVDWDQDVVPALGETTAIAVYPPRHDVVVLTNPDDPDKTIALAKKLDAQEVNRTKTRVVGDWVALSESEAAIDDALRSGSASLAGDQRFTSAMAALPDDALSRIYIDPAGALEVFSLAKPELRRLNLDGLDFAGAWVTPKDDGAELALSAGGPGAARLFGDGEPYSSALLERVPDDALAFASFQGGDAKSRLGELEGTPPLRRFEREFGVKLEQLVALADGEVAFYARMALPFPELTLLLDSSNPEQARASAEKLLRAFAQREGGQVTEDGDVTTAVADGFPVNLGTVDDLVVFTTSKDAFEEVAASGDKLSDSDRFRSALESAGVPDEYSSLAWVDLSEAVALLQAWWSFNQEDDQVPNEHARNLEALTSLVAWGAVDGDVASARAFLEID